MSRYHLGWIGAAVLATLALAGCKPLAPSAAGAAKLEPVGQMRVDELHADCIRSGGEFLPGTSGFVCVRVPSDAGKSCKKASDCESVCLARSHTCAPVRPLLGCNDVLTQSGMAVSQCIE